MLFYNSAFFYFIVIFITFFSFPVSAKKPPNSPSVVTSIAPFYLITKSIMGKTGKPILLLQNIQSPHQATLKPSQINTLQRADLIIFGDPTLETFLPRYLKNLDSSIKILTLSKIENLTLLTVNSKNIHHKQDSQQASLDSHFWLSVDNAIRIAAEITKTLSRIQPQLAPIYQANLSDFSETLNKVKRNIRNQLSLVRHRPFFVLHDAYQYFEKEFHLNSVGILAIDPDIPLSAKRLRTVVDTLKEKKAFCLMAEMYTPKTQRNFIGLKQVVADPLGMAVVEQDGHFADLFDYLGRRFLECLSR